MYWSEFIVIATAHLLAVASPGPDFAVVMKQSVTGGTRAGISTSLGVGAGVFVHVSYCLLGMSILFSQSSVLLTAMKYMAAFYLAFLGVRTITVSGRQLPEEESAGTRSFAFTQAFCLGFLTNGLNPKATLFFLALFAGVINSETPVRVQLYYGLYMSAATFIWFALLSRLLGSTQVRRLIFHFGVWFERGMGAILLLLAAQIMLVNV